MSEASALMALQDIDLRLLRHEATLASMPQQRRIKTIGLARRKVASELTGIVGRRKDAQMEVADTEAALEHYREKALEVQALAEAGQRTHRELRDFEQQLTSLAKHAEKAEFSLTRLREDLARLERAERNAERTLARLDEERAAAEASLDEQAGELRAQIASLSRERERVVGELSPEHLAAYDVARRRFKGLAVERLSGNVPTVCRVSLQASQFHDLVHGDEITECPYCHRMLVTSEWVEGA